MKKRLTISLFMYLFVILNINVMADPVQWKTADGGNGHWYEAISVPGGITWTDADAAAKALGSGWHLATSTSEEENNFIYGLVSGNAVFWNCCLSGNSQGPWLGGIKVGPSVSDYAWVTGEPFIYTNWGPLEPFGNGERIGLFGYKSSEGPVWNDIGPDRTDVVSYIIETSTLNYPVPDIKANGSDGYLSLISLTDNLSVTVELDPGSRSGENADWWVVANVSGTSTFIFDGWFYLDVSTMSWLFAGTSYTDLPVTHQGPLFNLTTVEVLNIPVSGLPSGTFTFYFAVDTNMNSVLDFAELYYDSVVVNITP